MNRRIVSSLQIMEKGKICAINGDGSFHCFLMQNGLIIGNEIELYNTYSENYIIKINDDDSYFVINKKAADNIIVETQVKSN